MARTALAPHVVKVTPRSHVADPVVMADGRAPRIHASAPTLTQVPKKKRRAIAAPPTTAPVETSPPKVVETPR